jgi:DNA-binding IclR family transcriptional regulator
MAQSATPASPVGRVSGAESGRRLLSVLLTFSESRPLWTVAELSKELGMNASMVYRYVGLLREVGLVYAAGSGQYGVTDMVDGLAAAAAAVRAPVRDIVEPVVDRIRDEIGEAVLVARRSGWRVFTVARAESHNPVRLQFEPGQAMSLHAGALSRVLLASMPEEERRRYVRHLSEPERSLPSLKPDALREILEQGWAESFEEVDAGIWGVAAPIYAEDTIIGAIGCAAPLYRTDDARRTQIREAIRAGAAEISAQGTPGRTEVREA